MFKLLFLTLILIASTAAMAQLPKVSTGTLKRLDGFASQFVDPRNVDVWLPDGYSAKKKYAVLYMHDGQMLFDAETTWNKQEWGVDETVGRLLKDGKIRDTIVVGVWNNGEYRHSEYFPQKALGEMPQITSDFIIKASLKDKPRSDNYLKFLVEELKPYIDKTFSTKKERDNTYIAGSSMGGLISIYAICEYPSVFGGAAGISTHLPMITDPKTPDIETVPAAFRKYLEANLPKANSRKIYFDYGDQTLDALYLRLQKRVDELMKAKSWRARSWTTRFFAGENHSEVSWAKRLDIPLEFLLKK